MNINTESFFLLDVSLLDLEDGFLGIVTGVLGEGSGDDEEGIGEGIDTKLDLARDFSSGVLSQVLVGGNLE